MDQLLPRECHPVVPLGEPSIHWEQVPQKYRTSGQLPAFILQRLVKSIEWQVAIYEYPQLDDPHQDNVGPSADYAKEALLDSGVYQARKGRKTRGPGLLCANGAGKPARSFLPTPSN